MPPVRGKRKKAEDRENDLSGSGGGKRHVSRQDSLPADPSSQERGRKELLPKGPSPQEQETRQTTDAPGGYGSNNKGKSEQRKVTERGGSEGLIERESEGPEQEELKVPEGDKDEEDRNGIENWAHNIFQDNERGGEEEGGGNSSSTNGHDEPSRGDSNEVCLGDDSLGDFESSEEECEVAGRGGAEADETEGGNGAAENGGDDLIKRACPWNSKDDEEGNWGRRGKIDQGHNPFQDTKKSKEEGINAADYCGTKGTADEQKSELKKFSARIEFPYEGQAKIPFGVTHVCPHPSICARSIRPYAFMNCVQLEEVELWEGLEEIRGKAFSGCTSLKRISLPRSVKNIRPKAFRFCKRLEEVELREGLEEIGEEVFSGCTSLKRIRIPGSVKCIMSKTFRACERLEEVVFCEGLQNIDANAFEGCKSLVRVQIPSTVKCLRQHAFASCSRLEVLELSEGLMEIKTCAFKSCISLRGIKIPSTVVSVEPSAFESCAQLVVAEADILTQVDDSAFKNCFSLRNVFAPTSSTFQSCHDLLRPFRSQHNMEEAMKKRFEGLPIHKFCYYQSHHPTEAVLVQMNKMTPSIKNEEMTDASNIIQSSQDCIGMTPLHIISCSTKQSLDIISIIADQQPRDIITEDKWGCPPILYAIWCGAPEDIVQFLINRQKSSFPDNHMNWDKMMESLCRAGASLDAIMKLLEIHRKSFPAQSIDWRNAARELMIRCVVKSKVLMTRSLDEEWSEVLSASRTHWELVQSLRQVQGSVLPVQPINRLEILCNDLIQPLELKSWWMTGQSLDVLFFLVKLAIPQRLSAIKLKSWHKNIKDMVGSLRCIKDLDWRSPAIHSKLAVYECELQRLKDVSFLLELAVWKFKIDEDMAEANESGTVPLTVAMRRQCRINCGANIVVPGVLQFLVDRDEEVQPSWFVERVHVRLGEDGAEAIIREVRMGQALVETKDGLRQICQSRQLSIAPLQERDIALVTEGPKEGMVGELVAIDGEDAILKDSEDNFEIFGLIQLAKIGSEVRRPLVSGTTPTTEFWPSATDSPAYHTCYYGSARRVGGAGGRGGLAQ